MSILDTILDHKRNVEVPQRMQAVSPADMRRAAESMIAPKRDFAAALHRADGRVALIAEVKRASPSKGDLVKGEFMPVVLAQAYAANGAACISVLTDERFFKGSLDHLRTIRAAVDVPLLRKDFVVHAYQLYEARAAGADAALLIVAALNDDELRDLHTLATELGLTPLVEVHDEAETERAMQIGASVIGVNNRDLRTFQVDIETTARCARKLEVKSDKLEVADSISLHTSHVSLVSESGIFTSADVACVAAMGANAILVGESIITSDDIAAQVRSLSSVPSGK